MKKLLPLLCAILSAAAPAWAALDLSMAKERPPGTDGSIDRTYILNGSNKVYLRLPTDWHWTGDPQALALMPGPALATVRLEQIAIAQPIAFDAPGLAALRQKAASGLPESAADVKTISEEKDPILRYGWKSWETVATYTLNGSAMQQSTLILSIDGATTLRLRVMARKDDFAKIRAQTLEMLSTWFEPNKDLPLNIAREYGQRTDGA